ncbi:MAG: hypothetical protein FJ217_02940 [Ignavibacteria bacterium]|nr:hypothetical protein [Ignavibacteria bacterium]
MSEKLKILTDNTREVLRFLKSKYHFIHLSNVFFRDLQYGVTAYFESKGTKLGYADAEELAAQYVAALERVNILKRITQGSWMLVYPEFRKTPVKPAAPAKPAAAASPRPSTGAAPRQNAAGVSASLIDGELTSGGSESA